MIPYSSPFSDGSPLIPSSRWRVQFGEHLTFEVGAPTAIEAVSAALNQVSLSNSRMMFFADRLTVAKISDLAN